MFAIKALYDGNNFKLLQPIPKGNYEVIITFSDITQKTK